MDFKLTLTSEERAYLQDLLEHTLKATEIEEHRTRTLSYRQNVMKIEDLIRGILSKLRQPAS